MKTGLKAQLVAALGVFLLFLAAPVTNAQQESESQTLQGTNELRGPEIIQAGKLTIKDVTTIVTNGFPLTIVVTTLTVEGAATITSFSDETLSAAPAKARTGNSGQPGQSFNPGPNTEGQGDGRNGNPGGAGTAGVSGDPGTAGKDAGPIAIIVTGNASGTIRIKNDGAPGGDGGDGGRGGNGGSGQQGGRAVPNWHFGVAIGCAKGPGFGGAGGAGGGGGNGGAGGNGGNGGVVKIAVYGDLSGFTVSGCSAVGGRPGNGGSVGAGGSGGAPGFGGRGAPGCEGRIQERMGPPGQNGASGSAGPAGQIGTPGQHNLQGKPFFKPQN